MIIVRNNTQQILKQQRLWGGNLAPMLFNLLAGKNRCISRKWKCRLWRSSNLTRMNIVSGVSAEYSFKINDKKTKAAAMTSLRMFQIFVIWTYQYWSKSCSRYIITYRDPSSIQCTAALMLFKMQWHGISIEMINSLVVAFEWTILKSFQVTDHEHCMDLDLVFEWCSKTFETINIVPIATFYLKI